LPYSGYTHKYYVNGQISVGDVYVSSTTGWRTYLVGGLAQGGKSIFALDVSDPTGFDENDILWEYNSSASDTRLGLTYGKPQIAPLNNGQWAVVFGNGYNSSDEKAYLYVVNILDGTLIARLATNSSTSNGLSTPYLYDSDGDQLVDVAYAGDLQGNLWRFDLKSSGWQSQSGRLLFSAKNSSNQAQPITAQPVVSDHPTRGVLVYIGTGSYIATSDLSNTQQQSFYGIWDDPNTTATVLRSQLLQQTITSTVDNASSSWRVTSNNSIDWTTQRGWYMDLPASVSSAPTERVTNAALVIDGNTGTAYQTSEGQLYWRVIFTTVINYSDPCKQGGTGWIMELDLHTGGQPKIAVLDYNNDKNFTNADWYGAVDSNNDGEISDAERIASGAVSVSGKKLGNDGIPGSTTTVSYTPTGGGACTLYKETAMSTGAPEQTLNKCIPDEVTNRVRVYWQQIL
jgi:type IV pilus assembly protein PilY1